MIFFLSQDLSPVFNYRNTYINEGIMGAGAMTFEFHWKNMESWVGTKTFTLFQRILKGKD
jgi:hypothetical protein